MNPYQFVPLGPAAPRRAARTHESLEQSRHAGTLVCRLTTLTEFFIATAHERTESNEHQRLQFLRENARPIIPGSSLKGVVRSVAEALSGSCLVLAGDRRRRSSRNDVLSYLDKNRQHDYNVSQEDFSPCGQKEEENRRHDQAVEACPACRMFGYLWGKKAHLGHVNFSAAHLLTEPQWQWLTLAPAGSPAPRHRPFYGKPETGFQTMRGRKFYFHRPQGARTTTVKDDQNKTVEALLPSAEFEFTIDYENLTDDELALLIFALELEEHMRHKLGMGKGLGLGSVEIKIREWRQIDLRQRYRQFDGGKQKLNDEALPAALQAQRERYHQTFSNWRESLQKLREIWGWDENDKRRIEYPTFSWFKDFRALTLEEVPDDAGSYGVRTTSPRPTARVDTPSRANEQREAESAQKAQALLKKFEREQQAQAPKGQSAYKSGDTEKKALVESAADGLCVRLPKLPEETFPLKRRLGYSLANPGAQLRVRVVVDGKGNITRAEEL